MILVVVLCNDIWWNNKCNILKIMAVTEWLSTNSMVGLICFLEDRKLPKNNKTELN